jgi:sugar lactone lactonase YvrE
MPLGAFRLNSLAKTQEAVATNAWDIDFASYDSVSKSVSSEDATPRGVEFKSDGTKMYMIGTGGDKVYQYSLSTAWDVSSASYDSVQLVAGEATPQDIRFKPDGTKMFTIGSSGDTVREFALSTAWDLSSATFTTSFSVAAQNSVPVSLAFNDDGSQMIMAGVNTIYEYGLSTNWDMSTASYNSVSFSTSSQEGNVRSIQWGDDGNLLLVTGINTDDVLEYACSTPYDISTATYSSKAFDVGTQATNISGMAWKPDGTRFYIMDTGTDTVYQYSIS